MPYGFPVMSSLQTIVFQTILDTEFGQFFLCFVRTPEGDTLTCHPILNSNGVDVIYPPEELDKQTLDGLIAKMLTMQDM